MRVVVGLGSNLGDRGANIADAIARLAETPGIVVERRSPLYESPPAGGPPQPHYVNAAVLIDTTLALRELLDRALAIERALGRVRRERWGPRVIDLDLLWAEGICVDEPGLEVPHPRLTERSFALRPLLDVAPDAADPRSGRGYASYPAAHEPLRPCAGAP